MLGSERRERTGRRARPHRRPSPTGYSLFTALAPCNAPLYEALAKVLTSRLDAPVDLRPTRSYAPFLARAVDLGLICGLPYAWLTRRDPGSYEPLVAPVLAEARVGGRPAYFSDVIVRRDRPGRTLDDLRGRRWGYNEPASHSGHGVVAWTLARRGLDWGHFGAVLQVGSHERAIAMVADGRLDAAAIDGQVLAHELREDGDLRRRLRVLETLGPSPIQPLVAGRRVPSAVREAVRDALIHDVVVDPLARSLMRRSGIVRFTTVEDSAYDATRAMAGEAEAAGLIDSGRSWEATSGW